LRNQVINNLKTTSSHHILTKQNKTTPHGLAFLIASPNHERNKD